MTPAFDTLRPHVVIVGGGLAGLAAAVGLTGRGLRITLLESRPRLGGRASSFVDATTGELVDNCQHVSMACCTNLRDFCERVGSAHLFRDEPRVLFVGTDGRLSTLSAGALPAPLHLTTGFLGANYLRWSDKLKVAFGLACLAANHRVRADQPFAEWLLDHGQTPRTINLFWATVLVSALNERLEQMDAGHARKVFVDGFLRNRTGYRMQIPVVPLGELYGSVLETWLAQNQVAVRLTTGVRDVCVEESRVTGVTLRSGERLPADFVVLAVPFDRVARLLGETVVPRIPGLSSLDEFRTSPIVGVHLWFDRPVFPHAHAALVGRLTHWVFNHSALQGRRTAESGGDYLQVVISAAYDLEAMENAAIRDAVLAELRELWPAFGAAGLVRWRVVTEHGATFSVRPGVEAIRPPQRTPLSGLFLAGDWTDTGWPATMEGAVRSGYRAAEGILEDLGQPEPLVCADLPAAPLARVFLPSPPQGRHAPEDVGQRPSGASGPIRSLSIAASDRGNAGPLGTQRTPPP